jgi:hypothetical protein
MAYISPEEVRDALQQQKIHDLVKLLNEAEPMIIDARDLAGFSEDWNDNSEDWLKRKKEVCGG